MEERGGTELQDLLDARNVQQHSAFPFQRYALARHSVVGHQHQSQYSHHYPRHRHGQHECYENWTGRSGSGSPVEERSVVIGTTEASTHGSSVKMEVPSGSVSPALYLMTKRGVPWKINGAGRQLSLECK